MKHRWHLLLLTLLILYETKNICALEFPRPSDLPNCGNSCFINSTLQFINRIVPLHNELIKPNVSSARPIDKENNLLLALAQLLRTISSSNLSADLKEQLIKNYLENFSLNSWNIIFSKKSQDQEDATEFLIGLLNLIDKNSFSRDLKGALDSIAFTQNSIVSCPGGYESTMSVKEYIANLALDQHKEQNLNELWGKMIEPEILDEFTDNAGTKHVKECTRTLLISTAPDYLFISLKRFVWNTKRNRSKIQAAQDIPLKHSFEFSKNDKVFKENYELVAFIHHGGDLTGGHYVAYVKKNNTSWYLCNDSVITEIKVTDSAFITAKNTAYIYAYKKESVVETINQATILYEEIKNDITKFKIHDPIAQAEEQELKKLYTSLLTTLKSIHVKL